MKQWILLLALTACITGLSVVEEQGSIEVLFCDKIDCLEAFKTRNFDACAMYHSVPEIRVKSMVVDGSHPQEGSIIEWGNGLMHNKFCVADGLVWTGSWNPSQGMTIPNNVVILESETLANAYRSEFDELSSGVFHGGRKGSAKVLLNGYLTEAYFCPEDNCQGQVLRVLKDAKESIFFMAYSFTDDEIGGLLVEKLNEGVEVKGILDPRKDKYSEYGKLKDVITIKKVHHKVFIVDRSVVITGSYNPSKNGNEVNDENILILRQPDIVEAFLKEFSSI